MKRILSVLCLSLLVMAPRVWADGPDEQYVTIYSLIQQGDALCEKGQNALAIARYRAAEKALQEFQKNYPDWNLKVVHYRAKYLADKITLLSSQPQTVVPAIPPPASIPASPPTPIPSNAPPLTTSNGAPPMQVSAPAPEAAQAPPPVDPGRQITNLQDRIHDLETDKTLLQAKLKEALAAQPVALDPQELARAQDQLKKLQKENELLKASLAEAKLNVARTVAAKSGKIQQDLDETRQKVSQLTETNAALALENEALQTKLKSMFVAATADAALRDENAVLKKQLSELQSRVGSGSTIDEMNRKLKESQTQLAALESDKEILRLEKVALENRVKEMSLAATPAAPLVAPAPAVPQTVFVTNYVNAPAPMPDSGTAAKIAQLETQRNELQASLNAATRELEGNKKGSEAAATRVDELTRQMTALRARIDVLEAHPVEYSSSELDLLSKSNTTLIASARVRKPATEPPASSSVLLAEAQRYFVAHEWDKAEAKYLEELKLDDKNVVTLADLGSIEIELGRFADAEKYLRAALDVQPDDDYSLFVLGQLKFREKSYDEALDALSRAAQLNPKNAKIQNFLGLTLTEKGLRGPAETAFRKAIQLDPGFADAHINLAVVYITQQPPLAELARWHYQKALSAGHAANPGLEKLLNAGGVVNSAR